jgi:sulfur carrier protein ThiS
MATVVLAPALARWLPGHGGDAAASLELPGDSVHALLEQLFAVHPKLRGYLLDERGRLRRHVALFVDGTAIPHQSDLQQGLRDNAEVYVMQALSGG